MTSSIARLSAAISQSLSAHRTVQAPEPLERFPRLAAAGVDLYERFERAEKALPPPEEKRRAAISKFRNVLPLNASEWRLVFAGLSDKSESVGPILNDDQLYARVHDEVHQRIEERRLSRRDWLALCFSYFGYDAATPAQNANWCLLREDVQLGFECVRDQQKRVKEWVQIVQQHQELFSEQAGATLGDQMFKGEISDLSALQTIAQIPDNSWLWRRIFTVLISRIFMLDDAEFSQRLADLVDIGRQHPRYMNDVLSACLSRYHLATYREKPSSLLKQLALDNWGSPQIRSRQNSWLQYVDKDVCAMVVAWFAKEDLEHFFNLLKGDDDVDQSRLFYWLRFANQMSYTRIIMGSDAWSNEGRDFAHFREKNKGRLGRLIGAAGHNNAVVMQIGNYFFVEFSGMGACYVYQADKAPFDPEKSQLGLATEIKQRHLVVEWMRHFPAPSRSDRVEGWLIKFDDTLERLGIRIQSQGVEPVTSRLLSFDYQLRESMRSVKHTLHDRRAQGGAIHIQLEENDQAATIALRRLGFKPENNKPLRFWRE